MGRFLTKTQLDSFDKYKYRCIDTNFFGKYVMHPFWNWCVQFCPLWLAPNLITFVGFLLTVCNYIIFGYYDYYLDSASKGGEYEIPRCVWALAGVLLFVAYTLDGIDGKQARRTGCSGPLGELFDHGLDSYAVTLIPICLYSIFGRKELDALRFFFVLWNIMFNFYLPHWEKYNTGVMFLPWAYDLTMTCSSGVLLVRAATGDEPWHRRLPGGFSPAILLELTLYSSAVLTSHTLILWNVYKSYRDGTGKMRSFQEAVRPLVPLAWLFILSTAWAIASPSNIIQRDPRTFYLLIGTIFSNINCRLIISEMSESRCEIYNELLITYAMAVVTIFLFKLSPELELLWLYSICVWSSIYHIYYSVNVVRELCDHFKIQCFSTKHSKSKSANLSRN